MSVETEASVPSEREWWLRIPLVLQSPRSAFAALRDDSTDAAEARQEPLTAVVFLAGIAGVLGTTIAGRLLDDPEFDALTIVVWAIVGGAIYGLGAYFLAGAMLFVSAKVAGSLGSFRRARHLLALAAVPVVLSLVVWPVRLAVHGSDVFRTGGGDTGGADTAFELILFGLAAWAAALLVVGVRVVHAWSWPRAAAVAAPTLAVPALAYARAAGLI